MATRVELAKFARETEKFAPQLTYKKLWEKYHAGELPAWPRKENGLILVKFGPDLDDLLEREGLEQDCIKRLWALFAAS